VLDRVYRSVVFTLFLLLVAIGIFNTVIGEEKMKAGDSNSAKATFAGGCFWCMQPPFDKLTGVLSTTVGYTGGEEKNPTYKDVASGSTSHTEAIQIEYNPDEVSYEKLLEVFWQNVDPTDGGGQFCDRGNQYRTGIFAHNDKQRKLAEQSKEKLSSALKADGSIVTEITQAGDFYDGEDYHQDYYKKNPIRYKLYRTSCGRDRRLKALWGNSKSGK